MGYKKLAADLLSGCEENCADCEYAGDSEFECTIAQLAATAITDLLARAEAAEARCETLEKMVNEYQDVIVPGYRERAEKAEKERDAAVVAIYTLVTDCPPETCREICANHDGVCAKHAEAGHYDHCKGFKWIGEKEG